jgi:hypothetical protein
LAAAVAELRTHVADVATVLADDAAAFVGGAGGAAGVAGEDSEGLNGAGGEGGVADLLLASAAAGSEPLEGAAVAARALKKQAREHAATVAALKTDNRSARAATEAKAAELSAAQKELAATLRDSNERRAASQLQLADEQAAGAALAKELEAVRADRSRLEELFAGKEQECQDAYEMSREQVERTVEAEAKVEATVQLNSEMLDRIKREAAEHEAVVGRLEALLTSREETLVQQEALLTAGEAARAAVAEKLAAVEAQHQELKVMSAGEAAALQARLDRKATELERVQALSDEYDAEKDTLRASCALHFCVLWGRDSLVLGCFVVCVLRAACCVLRAACCESASAATIGLLLRPRGCP